jgi:glycosyltransferase involved in cell wall biosynthesis
VEAQLALRPVVATAALGHLESIGDEETGLLVPAGDVEAMAKAVARLIDEPGLAAGIAGRARRSAAERFSTSRYEREVVQVLSGLVGRTS